MFLDDNAATLHLIGRGIDESLIAGESTYQFDPAVSPDRTRIVYAVVERGSKTWIDRLIIAGPDGHTQTELLGKSHWFGIAGWLDNNRLVLRTIGNKLENGDHEYGLEVLDIANNNRETPLAEPSDIYRVPPVPSWGRYGLSVPAPALDQLVYLAASDDQLSWAYSLWDIRSNTSLFSMVTFDNDRIPIWSPSGEEFALAASEISTANLYGSELFVVDKMGAIIHQTQLGSEHAEVLIQRYSWSHDGTKIAFWLNVDFGVTLDEFGEQQLAVYDLDTEQVNVYCTSGDQATSQWILVPAPIWSPDSNSLLIMNRSADDRRTSRVVELASETVFEVQSDGVPVGWMKNSDQ